MPYQPMQQISVEVNGFTLTRPVPTNSGSLRCKLGFHSLVNFVLKEKQYAPFVEYCSSRRPLKLPKYCERCSRIEPGHRVPPKPPVQTPKEEEKSEPTITEEELDFIRALMQGEGEPHDLGRWWDEEHQKIMADRSAIVAYFVNLIDTDPEHAIIKHVTRKAAGNGLPLQSEKFSNVARLGIPKPPQPPTPPGPRIIKDGKPTS